MFQYPGFGNENLKENVSELRRWLARFVPELERKLDEIGTDNFTTAYNERVEGVTPVQGTARATSTSAALAEHLLDHGNPHGVTMAQVGLVQRAEQDETHSLYQLGPLLVQVMTIEIDAAAATAAGSVYKRSVSLGDWAEPFSALYAYGITLEGTANQWAGPMTGADEETCGDIIIYTPTASGSAGSIRIWGIGRSKDGGQ